jgi:hypothetical protein
MGRMGRMGRMVMGQWDEGTNLWGTMGQWDSTPPVLWSRPAPRTTHHALSPCTLLPAPFLDTLYISGKITSYHIIAAPIPVASFQQVEELLELS